MPKSTEKSKSVKKTANPDMALAIANLKQALGSHGGDIELISFIRGTVKVRLAGACHGCPMASMTLQNTVEGYLRDNVPGVKKVVAVE